MKSTLPPVKSATIPPPEVYSNSKSGQLVITAMLFKHVDHEFSVNFSFLLIKVLVRKLGLVWRFLYFDIVQIISASSHS